MRKYKNIPEIVDNIRFASKAEAKRYRELKLLEKAGVIDRLRLQPRYNLYGRENHLICTYVADFEYYEIWRYKDGWTRVVEDVKSPATAKLPVFKLKAKLFRDNFGFDVTVIK